MANVGTSAVRIIDSDNDVVTVTNNRLDVNAVLGDSASIDIGDVSLLLGGTAASVNNGSADATTLRVTIASDTTGVLSIDDNNGSLTIDGTVTANLSATDNAALDVLAGVIYVEDTAHSSSDRGTFVLGIHNEGEAVLTGDGDYSGIGVDRYGAIAISARFGLGSNILSTIKAEDTVADNGDDGIHILSVRKDTPSTSSGSDGDYSSLISSVKGALYVDQIVHSTPDTFPMIVVDDGVESLSSNTGTIADISEIFLQADEDNSGYIMVGDDDVADNRGMKLNPGDTLILNNSDSRTVSLLGSAAGQNLRCMLIRRDT
jgi:hypothetical protein